MSLSRRNLLTYSACMIVLAVAGRRSVFGFTNSGFAKPMTSTDQAGFATTVERDRNESGILVRSFEGAAAPPEALVRPDTGERIEFYAQFPNDHDPFAINAKLKLGHGGFDLRTIDRGLMGVIPGNDDAPWSLNMIPFGIALDASIMDPSGPWYDGGPADPNNPFDRKCSGWEYEVTHPDVMKLVGVPSNLQGHVQPGGIFHYHGYPAAMISVLRGAAQPTTGSLVVGYSADGFPVIDYRIAAADGSIWVLVSGYVLRQGPRKPSGRTNPMLTPPDDHDGLYVQDYQFDPDAKRRIVDAVLRDKGDWYGARAEEIRSGKIHLVYLDESNALVLGGALPTIEGYPSKHYAYALTPDWPKIPRQFAMEPDVSFRNIIPLSTSGIGGLLAKIGLKLRPSRAELYANCPAPLQNIRTASGRVPY